MSQLKIIIPGSIALHECYRTATKNAAPEQLGKIAFFFFNLTSQQLRASDAAERLRLADNQEEVLSSSDTLAYQCQLSMSYNYLWKK